METSRKDKIVTIVAVTLLVLLITAVALWQNLIVEPERDATTRDQMTKYTIMAKVEYREVQYIVARNCKTEEVELLPISDSWYDKEVNCTINTAKDYEGKVIYYRHSAWRMGVKYIIDNE